MRTAFSGIAAIGILVSTLLAACASIQDAGTVGINGIQGTWLPATAELGGKALPEVVRGTIKLMVDADKYIVTIGKDRDEGTIFLKPASNPKEMDILGTEGPNKGRTILAIYERVGDTLRICYDLGGDRRPTEFVSREGTKLFLVNYKREKS
jgi:uncharacterized protein (TIGR03067 family)